MHNKLSTSIPKPAVPVRIAPPSATPTPKSTPRAAITPNVNPETNQSNVKQQYNWAVDTSDDDNKLEGRRRGGKGNKGRRRGGNGLR